MGKRVASLSHEEIAMAAAGRGVPASKFAFKRSKNQEGGAAGGSKNVVPRQTTTESNVSKGRIFDVHRATNYASIAKHIQPPSRVV